MPISPFCLVRDGASAFVPTTNGVNGTPGNTITIKLADSTGVVDWYLEVTGFDELSSAPALASVNPVTHKVLSPAALPSFSLPAANGRAFLLTSTVVDGSGPSSASFAVYTLTDQGLRVAAAGETVEGNTLFGWATVVNPLVRSGAPILRYDDSLVGPTLGALTIQQAIDALKAASPPIPQPPLGKRWDFALTTNIETTNTTVARRIGSRALDFADFSATVGAYAREVRLHGILEALSGTVTIKLTDVTLDPPVLIVGTTLTTNSSSPIEVVSGLLGVLDVPGYLWASTPHNYELTVESTGVGTSAGVWLSVRYV